MWRFTKRGRGVVFFAQEEATRLGENRVGPEHLLLGLLRESDSIAARILDRLAVRPADLQADVEREVTSGAPNLQERDMELTPQSKQVIHRAHAEARAGGGCIGTQHLLLALGGQEGGPAARVLLERGVTEERVRETLQRLDDAEGQES